MTTRIKTITDHLLDAQSILDEPLADGDNVISKESLVRASECIDKALNAIQLVRAEVQGGLDKF